MCGNSFFVALFVREAYPGFVVLKKGLSPNQITLEGCRLVPEVSGVPHYFLQGFRYICLVVVLGDRSIKSRTLRCERYENLFELMLICPV